MRQLEDLDLLRVWEEGRAQHPVDRALTLLAAALPHGRGELAALALGERNALLLELREATFGARMAAFAPCPTCGASLDLATTTAGLAASPPSEASAEIDLDGVTVVVRPLDSRDLAAIAGAGHREDAVRMLARRCVVSARRGEEDLAADELVPRWIERLAERIAALDPLAEIVLAMTCPTCGHAWKASFDPGAYLWTEIGAHVRGLMRDVHSLASAYGWREDEVLALPAWRRRAYVEMTEQ